MPKCKYCDTELTTKDVVLSSNGFLYCKHCKEPLFDMHIQTQENYFKQNIKKIKKVRFDDLLMQGYL